MTILGEGALSPGGFPDHEQQNTIPGDQHDFMKVPMPTMEEQNQDWRSSEPKQEYYPDFAPLENARAPSGLPYTSLPPPYADHPKDLSLSQGPYAVAPNDHPTHGTSYEGGTYAPMQQSHPNTHYNYYDNSQHHQAPPSAKHQPPLYQAKTYQQNAYHQIYNHHPAKTPREKPQVHVVTQASPPAPVQSNNLGDTMQMAMMNQMMMNQQMQSQQMQAAQMAAMNQQNMQMQAQQLQMQNINNHNQGSQRGHKEQRSRGSINIQSSQQKVKNKRKGVKSRRPLPPPHPPIWQAQTAALSPVPTVASAQDMNVETVALDNWQEATLLLCFAAVGLIYLVCSRNGDDGDDKKKKKEDLAKKHMS